ncbi:J domain-containing protein [Paenibacillus abyssi]|uniref:J domain-containing protein n=1 Tax=Paenibacillus abyssi TaxID=1340531 RepID=A0A917D0Y9_9BACL|nr:J domain-containing protein [Paenibacillus abyssi]GGG06395.1 hypothetical protein GCM10010916_24170 [Paenibacillus abyssi]
MDNLKQAYDLLGLPEDATKEEIEKRYMLLMRQARAQESRPDDQGSPNHKPINFEAVNRAYKQILEHEDHKALTEFNTDKYGKYKNMAGFAEKADHFFHYYKFHLIGAIALIILIVIGINSYLDNRAEQARLAALPPADVTVMYHGEYYMSDGSNETQALEQSILALFPDWQRVIAGITYVPIEPQNEHDMASLQKSILNLMTEKRDVYILDRASFDNLSRQGLLQPLDDAAEGVLKPLLSPDIAITSQTEDDPSPRVYGIDITESSLNGKLPLIYKEMIAGIRVEAEHPENALHFIQTFLQNN